ncbi:FliI/YscN family ATPase [Roseovarius phycicola]|uniref:FliI/YscN family ATPase n=1 Tax=Roseovarius phycicola TaxID=3080976 RepID=A0ABZ2HG05_9RHOB
MAVTDLTALKNEISTLEPVRSVGRVSSVEGTMVQVSGLAGAARLGDRVRIVSASGQCVSGEIIRLAEQVASVLPDEAPVGISLRDRVILGRDSRISPADSWIGRIVDPFGRSLDGRPLLKGPRARRLQTAPPPPSRRRALGGRLETGMAVFNTMLPLVRGQRIGLFAGSGVGKSQLLATLGCNMAADVVVFALIGERGRELLDFARNGLGSEGMKRSVIVAATSDQSPLLRRQCAWAAMCVAEHFRDQGRHVLFLADSMTRFAEAHREVAVAAGELPALRGFPASTAHMLMSICERAGPGEVDQGDITAVLSVLVAGSDMDEPISDILRGVLDGHVVMDRQIAERGRYPAIDLLRSVSRSLPAAATDSENALILQARSLLGSYQSSETMVRAGLYSDGSDPILDQAIRAWPDLDSFVAEQESQNTQHSFDRLALILRRATQSQPGSSSTKQTNTLQVRS